MMARSSQVRSTERRLGVSMAEVVMDDMAIGNPVSPCGPALALWASLPGIHIAQFPFQVIGNCGVIFLDALQQSSEVRIFQSSIIVGRELRSGFPWIDGTAPAIARWRCGQYDGIVGIGGLRAFSARPGGDYV